LTVAEDASGTIDVTANDTDPDGDTLTVVGFTPPSHGTASFTGNVATYRPAANYTGSDELEYTIDDGHGRTSTASVYITVTAVNDPPIAADDTLIAPEDTEGIANLLGNDSDPDGGSLTVVGFTQPLHGTASVLGGLASYIPAPNYNGPDAFTYTVADPSGLTASNGDWLRVNSALIEPILRPVSRFVDVDTVLSPEFLREKLEALSGSLAIGTVGVVGGLFATVARLFLVLFSLFYLLRDHRAITRALYDLVPLEEHQLTIVLTRTRDVISASVTGKVLISAIQGVLGCFVFWALGLSSAVLWGVVMFFLSMIPMAGSVLVWGPAAVFLLVTGAWIKGIILIAFGILIIGTIDNVLAPKLIGQRVAMHELLIFFAVLGGIQLFGILGLILGPVVVAVTLALIGILREVGRPVEAELTLD